VNQSAYDGVAEGLMQLAREIETSKRPGYTRGDDDVLANFKRAAEGAGITTEQAWAVFFLKHIDAIVSIMTKPHLAVSEAAEGRFADALNYLRLGYALLREREQPTVGMYRPELGTQVEIPESRTAFDAEVANVLATAEGYSLPIAQADGFGYTLAPHAKHGGCR
jgi:hypothetical protein